MKLDKLSPDQRREFEITKLLFESFKCKIVTYDSCEDLYDNLVSNLKDTQPEFADVHFRNRTLHLVPGEEYGAMFHECGHLLNCMNLDKAVDWAYPTRRFDRQEEEFLAVSFKAILYHVFNFNKTYTVQCVSYDHGCTFSAMEMNDEWRAKVEVIREIENDTKKILALKKLCATREFKLHLLEGMKP